MKFKQILGLILAVTTAASSLNTVFSAEPTPTEAEPVIEETITSDSALEAISSNTEQETEEDSNSEKVVSEEASEPTAEVSASSEEDESLYDETETGEFQSADLATYTTKYAVTDGYIYFDADTGAITSCDTSVTRAVIPNSINGVAVTAIDSKAFYRCSELKSISIPSSVVSIGNYAFYRCTGLTSVSIPSSVVSIGNYAFDYCTGLKRINIPSSVTTINLGTFSACSSLTNIAIPNSVVSIGNSAFRYCDGLTSITIPDKVTSIGSNAFSSCTGLTNVTIQEGVTDIGSSAFSYCSSLTSITMPSSITSIGSKAFLECSFKTAGPIGGGYDYEFGWTETIPAYAFQGCESLTSINIPENVISIGNCAFNACTSLPSITIPDKVTSIGNYAFSCCTDLTSITIPDSVASIGKSAFYYCISLPEITIPSSVTSIGSYAFRYCTSLKNAAIPNGVTSIESYTFGNCTSLASVIIPSNVTSIDSSAFSGCEKSILVLYVKEDSYALSFAVRYSYSYVILQELKAESVDYCTGISEVLEADDTLRVNITFNSEFEIVGGEITVTNEDNEEEFKIYSDYDAAEANGSQNIYFISEDDDKVLTLAIKVLSKESDDSSGLTFYDVDLLTCEELEAIIDDTVIKPVDELTCEDGVYSGTYFGRQNITIDLDDYYLDYPEDIFKWLNSEKYFNNSSESHYSICDELAGRINPSILNSNIIIKKRYVEEWGGSCFGMSALISLVKNGLFDLSTIVGSATEINNVACPRFSTFVGGVRDWINYLQLLQCDKNYSKTATSAYMTDSFGENFAILAADYGWGATENKIKTVLKTIVSNAKAGNTTYTFDFGWLKKENGKNVIHCHTILPFGYYYDEDSDEYKILCYDSSDKDMNMYSIVTINSDYTDFTVSDYEDNNMVKVGYTDLTKFNSQFDLSAVESPAEGSTDLPSLASASEDNVLWLQSIGDFKISGGGKCLTYDDGVLSGDYDIVEDFDIIASDSDSPAMLRITLADADSYTVSTETGSLDCTLSTGDMFGFSVTKGSGLSVEFDCVNNAVKTEGTISEYSAALAYDEDDTVIINGTDETKIVISKGDEIAVSTESGGEVTLDIIDDGEKTDSETVSDSDNITIVKNETGLEVSSENTSTEASTEILTETSTETSTEILTETSTETSTEILTETSTETSTEAFTETSTEILTETSTETTTEGEFVSPPAFDVAGVFGGRNVTFTSETDGAVIYYSSTSSTLTTDDISVPNGETVLFEDFYGTIYARAYHNGSWSNVARLILKIPVVNTPTVTASGSTVTVKSTTPSSFICYTTDGTEPVVETDGTVTNGTWLRVNGARTNSGTITASPGDTVRAVAVRSCFTTSASAAAYVKVEPAAFKVVGTFGGRNVTFTSDTSGAKIYYSSTTSSLTTSDTCVSNGETVLFEDFYGTIYARAYYNGKWSNVSRLILKIPTINDPTITYDSGKATIRTTTPNCYIYYTTDGTTPSITNGKKLCSNSYGQVSVSSGTTIKAIAVRSCFTNSTVTTYKVS